MNESPTPPRRQKITPRRIARLWAGYNLGDPSWADEIARVLGDPGAAENELRSALGSEFEWNLFVANEFLEDDE